jgi:hypothetical protein
MKSPADRSSSPQNIPIHANKATSIRKAELMVRTVRSVSLADMEFITCLAIAKPRSLAGLMRRDR